MIGLFHRAIAQSGSALCPWAAEDPSLARSKAFRLGEALGCKTSDSDELLEFLMKVPAQNIVEGFDKVVKEEVSVSSFLVTGKFVSGLDNSQHKLKNVMTSLNVVKLNLKLHQIFQCWLVLSSYMVPY